MAAKRKYDEGCAIAHALDLVGERWGILIVRELLLGPKRFTDLRSGMPGASADVLTQRLRDLQAACVVTRRKLPPPAGSWVYELTAWGAQLEPAVLELGRWGVRSPQLRSDAPVSIDSLILALPTLFDPSAAADFEADLALDLAEGRFVARVSGGRLEIRRDETAEVDATLRTDRETLVALVFGDLRLAQARRGATTTVEGTPAVIERFLTLFPMPEPVAPC